LEINFILKRFYLFRSNLKTLEYYHDEEFKNQKYFEENCHDFYLLFPLQLLKENYFDEVIIWRLSNEKINDIIFEFNNKKYIQRWVKNFKDVFKYPKSNITFFRGGFKEYDEIMKINKDHFGTSMYLGASKRMFPEYGGNYDIILLESEIELNNCPIFKNAKCLPFYKTTNSNVFKPLGIQNKKYDICWPFNFSQIKYKGAEFFMETLASCHYLKSLKIVHCGNEFKKGKELCQKYHINNIEFVDSKNREELNLLLNQSKFGLVTSNLSDGCPRISTEILMSGTPLLIRDQTRLFEYYKLKGVVKFNDVKMIRKIKKAMENYELYLNEVLEARKKELKFETICRKNFKLWNSFMQKRESI